MHNCGSQCPILALVGLLCPDPLQTSIFAGLGWQPVKLQVQLVVPFDICFGECFDLMITVRLNIGKNPLP